jgi:hypothetical protein
MEQEFSIHTRPTLCCPVNNLNNICISSTTNKIRNIILIIQTFLFTFYKWHVYFEFYS